MDNSSSSDPVVLIKDAVGKRPNFFKRIRAPFSKLSMSNKKIAGAILALLLIFGVGLGVFLVQRATQLRPRASANGVDITLQPATFNATVNQNFNLDVSMDAKQASASAAQVKVTFDSQKLQLVNTTLGSFMPTVLQQPTPGSGSVEFIVGTMTPHGGSGTLATLTFKPLINDTSTTVNLDSGGTIVTVTDLNTNQVGDLTPAAITVGSPDTQNSPLPTCTPGGNLVVNGSFEDPVLVNATTANGWQIYGATTASSTQVTQNIPGWDGRQNGATYQVEIHRGQLGPAAAGSQYAEVDVLNVESLKQTINTQAGVTYNLTFSYAPRPAAGSQKLAVMWNGQQAGEVQLTTPASGLSWQSKTFSVTATGTTSTLGFKSLQGNASGNELDNVVLAAVCPSPPPVNPENSLLLQPAPSLSVIAGQTVNVDLMARAETEAANLFVAKISFPKDLVEVTGISYDGSFVTSWAEKFYDNNAGEISLSGGLPTPGYQTNGTAAKMATITFRAKNGGSALIDLTNQSQIFSNATNQNIMQKGTDLTLNITGGTGTSASPSPTVSASPSPSPTVTASPSVNCLTLKGDGNGDCLVNLTDLSIMLSNFSATNPVPSGKQLLDFNDDNRINSFDFSSMADKLFDLGIIRRRS